jgi:hypothetical protein
MKKLNNEQIKEIKELRNKGLTQFEIATKFKVSISTIQYHTDEKQKNKILERAKNYSKNLPEEKRKELNIKRRNYWNNYQNNKYNSNEEYRRKRLNYQKEHNKKKRIKEGENESKDKKEL